MSLSRGGGALRLGFVRFPAFRTDRRVESRFPRVFAGEALDGSQLSLCVFFEDSPTCPSWCNEADDPVGHRFGDQYTDHRKR